MADVISTLMQKGRDYDTTRGTTRETTNQDIFKQFVIDADYPLTGATLPVFVTEANQYRASQGDSARTSIADDGEYNDCLREAAKNVGVSKAMKITQKRSGFRWRGKIAIKGANVNPGDLIEASFGQAAQKLRVIETTHQINANGYETILDVQEDENTEA